MDLSEHYNSPYRVWRCPACGNPSGRAGHINADCAPAKPVEYVRADTLSGEVVGASARRWTVMARHGGDMGGFGWLTIIGGPTIPAEEDGEVFEVIPAPPGGVVGTSEPDRKAVEEVSVSDISVRCCICGGPVYRDASGATRCMDFAPPGVQAGDDLRPKAAPQSEVVEPRASREERNDG